MHLVKRTFLILSLVLSFSIPLITFTSYLEITPDIEIQPLVQNYSLPQDTNLIAYTASIETNYKDIFLKLTYLLGALFLGFYFIKNLLEIIFKIKKNKKIKTNCVTTVLLKITTTPHTFFNYLFINQQNFENKEIPQEVFWHEEAHSKQKHSIDVLLIELLQIFFWFNPFVYLYKKAIKLNHEFLADEAVLNRGIDTLKYQNTLLQFSTQNNYSQLTNAINYSSIKKRLTVMKTKTSKKTIWIRSLITLPLVAIMLYGFSTKETVVIYKEVSQVQDQTVLPSKTVNEGASKSMMIEYKNFIKTIEETKMIRMGSYNRIVAIYDLMTAIQKSSVKKYPEGLGTNLSKTKAKAPNKSEYESWKDKTNFAIWIDGKSIENSKLNTHKISDFVYYSGSFVHKNARSKRFPQNHQFHLYTKTGFEKTYLKHNVNNYNTAAKKYTNELKLFLKTDRQDHSEIRILFSHAYKLYKQLSKEEKDKYAVKVVPPLPAFEQQKKEAKASQNTSEIKLIKNWFVAIDGIRYYYIFENRVHKFYTSDKKEVKLDIVKEYRKKHKLLNELKKEGKHYIFKSENDRKIMEQHYTDLGLIYFRMAPSKRKSVARISKLHKPYTKLITKNGKVYYKKRNEFTEEDFNNQFIPSPPPPPSKEGATSEQKISYEERRKKWMINPSHFRRNSTKKTIPKALPLPAPEQEVKKLKSQNHVSSISNNHDEGYIIINGKKHHYITKNGKTQYWDRNGSEVNKYGEIIHSNLLNISNKNLELLKHWYITIDNEKYYYTYKKISTKYYTKDGIDAKLDIVKEYTKKHKTSEQLKKQGKHYVFKTLKEQKEIEVLESDLGGMYFRMTKINKRQVKRPNGYMAPYVKLATESGETYYKKRNELTEDEKKQFPSPPPPPLGKNATPAEKKANEEAKLKFKEEFDNYKKRFSKK